MIWREAWCPECGKKFWAGMISRRYCTRACAMRAWRAAKVLEGTHNGSGERVRPA